MHEKFESSEPKVDREFLVSSLRERGLDDETRELFGHWYDEKVSESETGGTEARLALILDQASVLKEAGLLEDAKGALEDALMWAEGEGNQDAYDRIFDEMQNIK